MPSTDQPEPTSSAPASLRKSTLRATSWRGLAAQLRLLVRRYLPNEAQHLFALTLVVGVVCGLVAVAFHLAIRAAEALLIDRATHAEGSSWMVWTILSPTCGGLLAGVALKWIVPGARGSGIPQVKQAFAVERGGVRFRDALGKFVIASLQIGSGASLGREGPTVHICAGTASSLARLTALPPRNLRRLLPVGVAAGIAAAFNAPIAAVTFTIEEIVGALDQTLLSGVVVAAAVAAVIERGILGVHPVIEVEQAYGLDHPASLVFYALLGLSAAVVSVGFSDGLLKLRGWFRDQRVVPLWAQPAVGGLVTGVLAVLTLRYLGTAGVTGGGYATLGRALAGELGVRVLVALCVIKITATVFSYSSGGAGGIFAPSLFVGAMLGGAVGHLDAVALGHGQRELGAFALVGMGAVFAGVIRAPLTSVLIIFEMTGGYGLVLPLMLANMTSYVIARKWRPLPIYDALLAQDGVVLPHAAPPTHPLQRLTVAEAMTSEVLVARPEQPIGEVLAAVGDKAFRFLPVVDDSRRVLGVVQIAALERAPRRDEPVAGLVQMAHTIRSDASLHRAVVCMNDARERQLLVVDGTSDVRLVGVVAMSDVVQANLEQAPEGLVEEPARAVASPSLDQLLLPAVFVDADATLAELGVAGGSRGSRALVVNGPDGSLSLILPEHLVEIGQEEDLSHILIAADLARPAIAVGPDLDLLAVAAQMVESNVEAAVVFGVGRLPIGAITKTRVAVALLDASVASRAKEPARTSRP